MILTCRCIQPNKLYTIEPFSGTRILNVVTFEYSVDDEFRIKDPVGMCGKRLGGTFYILFGECFIVDRIVNGLISCKLEVKKFIPSHLNDAEPFLTKEELELLSLTKGLFNPDLE